VVVSGPGTPLTVHGGAGGVTARLDDLDAAAVRLYRAAEVTAGIAARAARIVGDPRTTAAVLLARGAGARAEVSLVRVLTAPQGATAVAGRWAALASGAAAAAAAYRTADATAATVVRAADAAAGAAAGRLLRGTAFAAGPVLVPPAALAVLSRRVDVPVVGRVIADALAVHPGLVEHAVDAAPGGVTGWSAADPLLLFAAAGLGGGAPAPVGVAGSARWIGSLGRVTPWLRESAEVRLSAGPVTAVPPPRGVADLVGGVRDVDPDRGAVPGAVRVVSVRGREGGRAWVVQIPGTQDWSPRAGANPFDLTGNVHGMGGEPTAGRRAVAGALRAAGAGPGEPVLLVGHSQGGIIATQLAGDPAFRREHYVTHVITAGSPVALAPVPESVAVLSLEHEHDLVPRLDGAPNPDRAGWVTVGRRVEAPGAPADAAASHDLGAYAVTAADVDASADPGLRRWRAGLAPFLAGEGVTATQVVVSAERRAA
jgi:PGAP1-like protein